MRDQKSTTDEAMELIRGMSDRDAKILCIVVHLLAHDPKAKTMPLADLWEQCGGEKLDAELRAKWNAIDAEHRGIRH